MIAKNRKVVFRLSRYKNALQRFRNLGFLKIYSEYLAEAVGVTSSVVRKDFSLFGVSGNKRGGYRIDAILDKLNLILGKSELQQVIIVGAGNIGSAIVKYRGFEKGCIKVAAAFDIDPAKVRPNMAVPVLPLDQMSVFVKENQIQIGILAVPDESAQTVINQMADAGIRGFLNFSQISVTVPNDCYMSSVNLEIELENLIYFVNAAQQAPDSDNHR